MQTKKVNQCNDHQINLRLSKTNPVYLSSKTVLLIFSPHQENWHPFYENICSVKYLIHIYSLGVLSITQ